MCRGCCGGGSALRSHGECRLGRVAVPASGGVCGAGRVICLLAPGYQIREISSGDLLPEFMARENWLCFLKPRFHSTRGKKPARDLIQDLLMQNSHGP